MNIRQILNYFKMDLTINKGPISKEEIVLPNIIVSTELTPNIRYISDVETRRQKYGNLITASTCYQETIIQYFHDAEDRFKMTGMVIAFFNAAPIRTYGINHETILLAELEKLGMIGFKKLHTVFVYTELAVIPEHMNINDVTADLIKQLISQ